jgi:DNA replication initiation complex subunit (GINS family)
MDCHVSFVLRRESLARCSASLVVTRSGRLDLAEINGFLGSRKTWFSAKFHETFIFGTVTAAALTPFVTNPTSITENNLNPNFLDYHMGGEIAVTFETLYDILMREKQREELVPIDPQFFQNVISYLKEKIVIWERISKETDVFNLGERDKVEAEIKNTRKVLKDIYERREKKIMGLAVNKSRIGHGLEADHLLDVEKKFFEALVTVLDSYRHGILFNLLNMNAPSVEEKKVVVEISGTEKVEPRKEEHKDVMMVRFVHAVPKFVASDLAVYGPFDEDDVGNIPREAAQILITKKRAEEVKKQ